MFVYFDIGGTKTRVALSEDGKTFGEPVKFDTPKSFEEGTQAIVTVVRQKVGNVTITAAGGGVAGPLDSQKTTLVNSPNLPLWVNRPLQHELSTLFNAPVFLENDTAMVGLGEAHHGAGKGFPVLVYITVSTGIGGVRIVNGRIDVSAYGFEPGHQYIDFDRSACSECVSATAEDYLSGTATAHRFGKKAYEVHDPQVWEDLSKWLAYFLNNTIVHWSPHAVVLGGSMIVGDPAIPVDRVAEHLRTVCTIYPELPVIKKADLADMGGIYGAMAYVEQQLHGIDNSNI